MEAGSCGGVGILGRFRSEEYDGGSVAVEPFRRRSCAAEDREDFVEDGGGW